MFSFLLPIASKIVSDAIDKIPDDAELGEKLIDLCLLILKKAQLKKLQFLLITHMAREQLQILQICQLQLGRSYII